MRVAHGNTNLSKNIMFADWDRCSATCIPHLELQDPISVLIVDDEELFQLVQLLLARVE